MNLAVVEIKAFVPARDFAASKAFYAALGFEIPWSSDDLAYVRHGGTSFLLQKFHVRQHADNFMMHMLVENVDDWYRHVLATGVVERYGLRIESPQDRPWRIRDFPITDPTGILWRIGQNIQEQAAASTNGPSSG
jgi:catechol 2,3-dioxygenase-like lactoylglutathione lyase family enzyme